MWKRLLILAIGGAVVFAGVRLSLRHTKTVPARSLTAKVAHRSAPVFVAPIPASDSSRTGCSFADGEAASYQLELTTHANVNSEWLAHLAPGSNPGSMALDEHARVKLHLRELSQSAEGAVMLARYTGLDTQDAALESVDLSAPFLVRIDSRCRLSGFARLASTPLAPARMQQALVHELWFAWPGPPGSVEKGENALGKFEAVVAQNPSDHTLQRRIIKYVSMWGQRDQAPVFPSDSFMQVSLGASGWFAKLSSAEKLTTASASSQSGVTAERIATEHGVFAHAPRDEHRYLWGSLLHERADVRTPMAVTQDDLRRREAVKALTPEQSISAYVSRVEAKTPLAKTWPMLAAYLEARPAAASELVNRLSDGEIPQEAVGGAYIALGRARTPEAKAALYSVMQNTGASPMHRVHAMMALIDRDDVADVLASSLASETSHVAKGSRAERFFAREAVLAVGAMAGRHDDPKVLDVAKRAVAEVLASGSDWVDLRPGFEALANIGDPSMLSVAAPFTRSPDAKVRKAATIVVRRMNPNDTAAFVTEWLRRETDIFVKRNLYLVMEHQVHDAQVPTPPAVVAQAIADLKSVKFGVVGRKSIIRLLGSASATNPAARDTLMALVPVELHKRSGLFNELARQLPPEQFREAIKL